jgi:hypothetical protein
VSDDALKPNEAIRLLNHAIGQAGITIVPKYVAQDLASLGRAHSDDTAFANAVQAVAREILVALRSPATHGEDTEYQLSGWRRCKFPSISGGPAHLRLVFRERKAGGMEILAFGDRELPQSVYLSAKERV